MKIILSLVAVLVLSLTLYKGFFPKQSGEWMPQEENGTKDSGLDDPMAGWEENGFWVLLDYPGKQNLCLRIDSVDSGTSKGPFQVLVELAPRASFYPIKGKLNDLFNQYSVSSVEEKIIKKEPIILSHLMNRVTREDKDIFLIGERGKYLISTRNIFTSIFPDSDLPNNGVKSELPYSDKLIGFPEGVLISYNDGVFVTSHGRLFLIRSPQVFESMGFAWDNVRKVDSFEFRLTSFDQSSFLNFNFIHPNGTVIEKNGKLFIVWEESLYEITSQEKSLYFKYQPQIKAEERKITANCKSRGQSIYCCNDTFDPRIDPPSYSNTDNAVLWKFDDNLNKKSIQKIRWEAKREVNVENMKRRLASLKQFLLYSTGFINIF